MNKATKAYQIILNYIALYIIEIKKTIQLVWPIHCIWSDNVSTVEVCYSDIHNESVYEF